MTGEQKKIRLLIVDDHRLIIDGLISLLGEDDTIEVAGGVTSAEKALEFLADGAVDLVLADINMPGMSGIEMAREIRARFPGTGVLALTMHDDNTLISKMIEAGASGYVLKSTPIDELLDAIHTVAAGGQFLSKDVQSVIMRNIYAHDDAITRIEPGAARLTARETEILRLIAKEHTNAEIAGKLFISERTVETHRKNIFVKTKTKTIVGLIRYAVENGLLEDQDGKR